MTNDEKILIAKVETDLSRKTVGTIKNRINGRLEKSPDYNHVRVILTPDNQLEITSSDASQGIPGRDFLQKIFSELNDSGKLSISYIFPNGFDINDNGVAIPDDLRGVYAQKQVLEQRVDDLELNLEKAVKSRDQFELDWEEQFNENETINKELKDTNSRIEILASEKDKLGQQVSKLRVQIKPLDSTYNAVLAYLSDASDKIDRLEDEIAIRVPSFSRIKSVDDVVTDARKYGIADSLEELTDLIKLCNFNSEDDLIYVFSELYKERNVDGSKKYEEAKRSVQGAEKTIAVGSLAEDLVSILRESLRPRNQTVTDYETHRDKFIKKHTVKLREYSDDLEEEVARKDIIDIASQSNLSTIPFYMDIKEEDEQYTLRFFIPSKRRSPSVIRDALVVENVIPEGLDHFITHSDFQNIQEEENPQYGLRNYVLNLSKHVYSGMRIDNIETFIKGNLNKGFEKSKLGEIGLEIEMLVSRRAGKQYGDHKTVTNFVYDLLGDGKGYTFSQICNAVVKDYNRSIEKGIVGHALNLIRRDKKLSRDNTKEQKYFLKE